MELVVGKLYTFLESSTLRDVLRGSHWMGITQKTFCVFHPQNGLTRHPETNSYIWNCGDINNLKPYTIHDNHELIFKYIEKFKFTNDQSKNCIT